MPSATETCPLLELLYSRDLFWSSCSFNPFHIPTENISPPHWQGESYNYLSILSTFFCNNISGIQQNVFFSAGIYCHYVRKKIPYLNHVVNLNIQFNVVFILRKIKILNAPFGIILMNWIHEISSTFTSFMSLISFCTLRNHQRTKYFLMFSRDTERGQQPEMG